MILKQRTKKKSFNYNIFFKLYFFLTIFIAIFFFSIFFNTGIWVNGKKDILHKIYYNGLNHYLNIFEITSKGARSFFYKYEEINLDIPYKKVILLEKNRSE